MFAIYPDRTEEMFLGPKVVMADGQTQWTFTNQRGEFIVFAPPIMGFDIGWAECVRRSPEGLILEFGVREGESTRELASIGRQVYGFDWWRGLPHDWDDYNPKGACLAQKPEDLPGNVELIEGLFSDTLEDFLSRHDEPVGFVNVDCDLYSSSFYVLNCLRSRFITGSLVALSAICLHPTADAQRRAWDRFLKETSQDWVLIGKQHAWGEVWQKQ